MVAADGVSLDDGLSSDHSGCCYTRMHLCVYACACDQGNKKELRDRLVERMYPSTEAMEEEDVVTSPDPLILGMSQITLGT